MMHNGTFAFFVGVTMRIQTSIRLSIVLRNLGFAAIPLHGQLSQSQRLGSLSKFQSGSKKILVATDVASR
jgi:ATP-dependent RNA helicase DDX47/RRP3